MITVEINGQPLPTGVSVRRGTLKISQEYGSRAECSFRLFARNGDYRPLVGQSVDVWDDATLIFSGSIDEPEETRIAGTVSLDQPIVCVDNHNIADRLIVAEAFTRQVAGDIVKWVIANVLAGDGVTEGVIQDGPEVGPVVSPHLYASQLLNELSSNVGYQWRINHDKTLDFFASGSIVGEDIDSQSDIMNVSVWRDRSEYRNKQIIKDVRGVTSLQTETPTPKPDGESQTFTLRFPVAEKPVVTIDSVAVDPAEVGILGIDDFGTKQWYWSKGQQTLTQDYTGTPLPITTTSFVVQYKGQYQTTIELDDGAAIQERITAEGGSGVYARVEDASGVDGLQAGDEKAIALLRRFARIATKVTLASESIDFQVGAIHTLSFPEHNVSGSYLVMSCTVSERERADGKLMREVVLVDGEAFGGWVEFFRTWLEKNRNLSVRSDEVVRLLARLVEQDMTAMLDQFTSYDYNPPFQAGVNIIFGRWQALA